MAACAADGLSVTGDDAILAIVPMFHANAWGLVYAALIAGADLVMPDRFLQAEPLVRLIASERPTIAGAVPTIWNDVLHYLEANPGSDISSLGLRQAADLGGCLADDPGWGDQRDAGSLRHRQVGAAQDHHRAAEARPGLDHHRGHRPGHVLGEGALRDPQAVRGAVPGRCDVRLVEPARKNVVSGTTY